MGKFLFLIIGKLLYSIKQLKIVILIMDFYTNLGGFFRGSFWGGRGASKIALCLKLVRIMLET